MRRIRYFGVVFFVFCLAPLWLNAQILPPDGPAVPLMAPDDIIPSPPTADEALPDIAEANNAVDKKEAMLNQLFVMLKHTADKAEAEKTSRQIQGIWNRSGSETIDLLMQWAENAIREKDHAKAMDFLDNVVTLAPDFSEGWMRRASLHVRMNDFALAMYDLNQTLRCEPRNFNAIILMAELMERTGRDTMALQAYAQALALFPQMVRAQSRLAELLETKTDRAI